jgi:hypothetical protein
VRESDDVETHDISRNAEPDDRRPAANWLGRGGRYAAIVTAVVLVAFLATFIVAMLWQLRNVAI